MTIRCDNIILAEGVPPLPDPSTFRRGSSHTLSDSDSCDLAARILIAGSACAEFQHPVSEGNGAEYAVSSVFELFPFQSQLLDCRADRSCLEILRSQSETLARRPLAGLCQTRCDPFPRRGTPSQPNDVSSLAGFLRVTHANRRSSGSRPGQDGKYVKRPDES